MIPKIFLLFYPTFKSKTSADTHESEKQDSVDQEIETEIKAFWLKTIYLLKKLKKLKYCLGGTQTRKNTHISPGLQEGIFWHHHLLFILKDYFQKLVTCTNKSEIDCFRKPAKNFYFSITTWNNKNRFLCSLIALVWVNIIY